MSKLVQMRQRIKAIETIKKVTHAMRLISMSAHTRMKRKEKPMAQYMQAIRTLFTKVHALTPQWKNTILTPPTTKNPRILIILIGSQKGLCGNFNAALFNYFDRNVEQYTKSKINMIAIGKKAVDFAQTLPYKLIAQYNDFNMRSMFDIAQEITDIIMHTQEPYASVSVFSNFAKSFFSQKPHEVNLIPFTPDKSKDIKPPIEGYIWEEKPDKVLDMLARQLIEAHIQYLLFQSLFAEQAARFISMDSSTRNANNLLDLTKLEYNKLRQAKITKELTELVASFETL